MSICIVHMFCTCLQEIWLYQCNDNFLGSLDDSYSYVCNSAEPPTDRFISGHAHGGVAILFRDGLRQISSVDIACKRLCGVQLVFDNVSFLIINVYMPVDQQMIEPHYVNSATDDAGNAFDDVLFKIEMLISSTTCDCIIVCGDNYECIVRVRQRSVQETFRICAHQ